MNRQRKYFRSGQTNIFLSVAIPQHPIELYPLVAIRFEYVSTVSESNTANIQERDETHGLDLLEPSY